MSVPAANSAHSLAVLVVEDDVFVRYDIAGCLREAGYAVIETENGECQSALDRDPRSASKRDPLVLRFERLALAPLELAGIAETGRARGDV